MSDNQQFGPWKQCTHKEHQLKHNAGNVFFVHHIEDSQEKLHVVKTWNETIQSLDEFKNEIQIAAQMDHPNIMNVVDYDLESDPPYMVTEFCSGGTLADADINSWPFLERQMCHRGICKAYVYLWENGYWQSNVNLHNIFLKADGKTPVLGDFEHVRQIEKTADNLCNMVHNAGVIFWGVLKGEIFSMRRSDERRINEKIDELSDELEDLKQQKAELLN